MKESEIKRRVAKFLRQTAKTVVLPATMSLGLGLAGCGGERVVQQPGDDATSAAPTYVDGGTTSPLPPPAARYGAPFVEPDAGSNEVDSAVSKYGAPFPTPDYAAPFPDPEDAGAPPNQALYAAPFPAPDALTTDASV